MPGQQIFAYRNLHMAMWSLMALDGKDAGRVVGHATELTISAPRFVVREAGRQRVIREGKKNVHAGIRGYIAVAEQEHHLETHTRVTYNPYRAGVFVVAETEQPVREASRARLDRYGKAWASEVYAA